MAAVQKVADLAMRGIKKRMEAGVSVRTPEAPEHWWEVAKPCRLRSYFVAFSGYGRAVACGVLSSIERIIYLST